MSSEVMESAAVSEEVEVIPSGAFEAFLGLAGLSFLLMIAFIFAYGVMGGTVTAGLDRACAEAAFESGKKLESQGNVEQAIQRYRQALEGNFRDVETYFLCGLSIGDLLMRQHRYAEAIEAYRALPAEAFRTAGAYTGYVTALYRDGNLSEARTHALAWLSLAAQEDNAEQMQWSNDMLMRISEGQGAIEEAIAHGRAAVALAPYTDSALILARLLARQGQREEAVSLLNGFIANASSEKLIEDARGILAELERQPA